MLVVPMHRKPGWRDLPRVTLLLVLANVLVFFLFQSGDQRVERRAAQAYIDSGVLAQEWVWFRDWAETTAGHGAEPEELDRMLPDPGENEQADAMRFMMIERQPGFLQAVRSEWFVARDSEAFRAWSAARERLEADRGDSFTRRYMLSYDDHRPVAWLSHMFMHGGLGHLIGNMVFLLVLGMLVEPALGGLRFLSGYLLGGLGAAAFSLWIHSGEATGMVGASGAIAGLMGLYSVVFGKRRVRFFYWAFVYFDYVRAPALVLLPVWLGWEVFLFVTSEGSNVAYDAHIGGIVVGALLGLLLVRTRQVNEDWLDSETADDTLSSDRRAVQAARTALDQLDAATAKRQLRPLLARHADDAKLHGLYFAACQLRPGDPDIHPAVRQILDMPGDTVDQRELVIDTWRRYLRATGNRPKIDVARAVKLADRLVDWGEFDLTRKLIDRLVRTRRPLPGLAIVCRKLADRLGEGRAAAHYRRLSDSMTDDSRGEISPPPA